MSRRQLPAPPTQAERAALVATPVTLDGAPARITGARLDFPIVRSAAQGVEFSWITAARIVASGGRFTS